MNCCICGYEAPLHLFVRPKDGGRRKVFYFCDENCKEKGRGAFATVGLVEATAVLGWDVFIPIGERGAWSWEEPLSRLSRDAAEVGRIVDRLAGEQ